MSEATFTAQHDAPEVGGTLLVSTPELREGACGGALVDDSGTVVGIIRGAVDDDPSQVVVVPAGRVISLARR